eukprot:PhF_6_TR24103/c1_g1_i1/m.33662
MIIIRQKSRAGMWMRMQASPNGVTFLVTPFNHQLRAEAPQQTRTRASSPCQSQLSSGILFKRTMNLRPSQIQTTTPQANQSALAPKKICLRHHQRYHSIALLRRRLCR